MRSQNVKELELRINNSPRKIEGVRSQKWNREILPITSSEKSCSDLSSERKIWKNVFNELHLDAMERSSSFLAALRKCIGLKDLEQGRRIHAAVLNSGSDSNIYVVNKLIDMYVKCGSMEDARQVFDKMIQRNNVSWNALMLGYSQAGDEDVVLRLFSRMKAQGFSPDSWSFVAALKACSGLAAQEEGKTVDGKLLKLRSLEKGMAIHSEASKSCCGTHIFVANMLIDMYAKCGSTALAYDVFDKTRYPTLVSWNTLMLGYAENGEEDLALRLFELLQAQGFSPDSRTFVAAMKACASFAAKEDRTELGGKLVRRLSLEMAMALHSEAAEKGCDGSLFVASSLVDTYAKCGSLADAQTVFERLTSCDVVTWNALLLGYAENGEEERALDLFSSVQSEGKLSPNSRTFIAALTACISLGALESGRAIHAQVCLKGLESDEFVASCLVDLYAKCGCLDDSQRVFDSTSSRDLMFWSSLIAGYSHHGKISKVLTLFQQMRRECLRLDGIVFLSVLTACSHAGLVDKGKSYFKSMVSEYGITPVIEHYHCMLDILGRANQLNEATALVETMPFKPNEVTWKIIMSACFKWKNFEVGKLAFESLMKLDSKQAAGYSLMANMYGSSNQDTTQA